MRDGSVGPASAGTICVSQISSGIWTAGWVQVLWTLRPIPVIYSPVYSFFSAIILSRHYVTTAISTEGQ